MKKYLLAILAMAVATGFSSFRKRTNELAVEATMLTITNVSSPASYASEDHMHSCSGASENPCKLDLSQIPPSYNVTDRTTLITYLNNNFLSPALRIAEVRRIASGWYQ